MKGPPPERANEISTVGSLIGPIITEETRFLLK